MNEGMLQELGVVRDADRCHRCTDAGAAQSARQMRPARGRDQGEATAMPGYIYRPEREAQVLRRIQDLNAGPLPDESVTFFFREVMSACLSLETPLGIAFLGPLGTFSESAAVKHFGHAARLAPQAPSTTSFAKWRPGMPTTVWFRSRTPPKARWAAPWICSSVRRSRSAARSCCASIST
jgi:chorismate mutase